MRVVCFHAQNADRTPPVPGLRPETEAALRELVTPEVGTLEFVDVGGSEDAYARALAGAWAEGGDLVVVEHDIVVRPDVFEAFAACDSPWCGFVHSIQTQLKACLGCTRFRADLLEAAPLAVVDASERPTDGMNPWTWLRLDVRLEGVLMQHPYVKRRLPAGRVCSHEPAVEHLNPIQRLIRGAH